MRVLFFLILALQFCLSATLAQSPRSGYLFLAGGKEIPPEIFVDMCTLSGKTNPKLTIIPTADGTFWHNTDRVELESIETISRWEARGFSDIHLVHTREREKIDENFVEPIRSADCIWILGGDQNRLIEAYKNTLVEDALIKALHDDKIVGGISAGSAVVSLIMIAGGRNEPVLKEGFKILGDGIIETHLDGRNRHERLVKAVRSSPKIRFGIGISEYSAICLDLKSDYWSEQSIKHYGQTPPMIVYNDDE